LSQPPQVDASGYDRARFIPEFYDYVVPYATRPDIGFYVGAARQHGGPVLELGCGTGRILIPTARAGIDISGLDSSEGMLKVCRARLDKEPANVRGVREAGDGPGHGGRVAMVAHDILQAGSSLRPNSRGQALASFNGCTVGVSRFSTHPL
jgi:SAM-dependent methyltransferase